MLRHHSEHFLRTVSFSQLRDPMKLAALSPFRNRGKQVQRGQAVCPRPRSQERQYWNAHPDLSCSVTGTRLHSRITLTGLSGRQGPGPRRRFEPWGGTLLCAAGTGLPGRGCGASGDCSPSHLPSQRDRQKPEARHQVTGRKVCLSFAHRCKGTHKMQGQVGHQGPMTQATPASLELVLIQVGVKNQEATVGGGDGVGTRG